MLAGWRSYLGHEPALWGKCTNSARPVLEAVIADDPGDDMGVRKVLAIRKLLRRSNRHFSLLQHAGKGEGERVARGNQQVNERE